MWGTTGIFVKLLTPYGFSSLQLTAIRATVAFISMAIFALIKDRRIFRARPSQILIYATMGVSICATAAFYFLSIGATSISTAVMLMYTAPIYVMIYSVIFFKEKFSVLKLLSVIFMFVGCALVSGIIGTSGFSVYGIIMGILAGISFAVYNVANKISAKKDCDSTSATLYSFAFMSLSALIVSKPLEIPHIIANDLFPVLPLSVALGIVTCVLPYFLYTISMRSLDASTASALGTIEPMAATLYSVIIFNEKLSIYSVIGISLILAAVIMLGKNEKN